MSNVAIGFRAHSGWSALVSVAIKKGEPVVLGRQRLQLVEAFTYEFRQPYHTAEKMPLDNAKEFISQVRSVAQDLAHRELRRLQAELAGKGHTVSACALMVASGRPLPELESILAAHPLIHTADGVLFREALAHAAENCGLRVFTTPEKGFTSAAANLLGLTEIKLVKRLKELGQPLGSPWSQDEKYAALAAWLALRKGKISAPKGKARPA
jgi:hypothetical protein